MENKENIMEKREWVCYNCGSKDIEFNREKVVFCDSGQLRGYPFCKSCGIIFDGKRRYDER